MEHDASLDALKTIAPIHNSGIAIPIIILDLDRRQEQLYYNPLISKKTSDFSSLNIGLLTNKLGIGPDKECATCGRPGRGGLDGCRSTQTPARLRRPPISEKLTSLWHLNEEFVPKPMENRSFAICNYLRHNLITSAPYCNPAWLSQDIGARLGALVPLATENLADELPRPEKIWVSAPQCPTCRLYFFRD